MIKVPKLGVWLSVDEASDAAGVKLQMIQRAAATKPDKAPADWSGAGKWVDVVTSATGMVSPIDGGKCWELPPESEVSFGGRRLAPARRPAMRGDLASPAC